MATLQRRDFLKASLATGVFAATGVSPKAVRAANEEIQVAVVGLGGRGGAHV
ncbi:twin-arginine translocation signal domain-containing protein, partial [bacterium]|nr:twin-arginine translocation signal domain-containing protein [bacterium]